MEAEAEQNARERENNAPAPRPLGLPRPNPFAPPRPNPFQGGNNPPLPGIGARPPQPFGSPRPPDPERQKKLQNAAPLPINSREGVPLPPPNAFPFPQPQQRPNFAQRPAPAAPFALPPIPAPAARPQPQPQPQSPRARNTTIHWSWYVVGILVFLLLRGGDNDSANRPPLQQISIDTPAALMTTLPSPAPTAVVLVVPVTEEVTADVESCIVTSLPAQGKVDSAGGGLKFEMAILTSNCVRHPLLAQVWITHADGLALDTSDNSRFLLQTGLTPTEVSGINYAQFSLPFSQLPLASGLHTIEGYFSLRDGVSGEALYEADFSPIAILIP